MTINIEELIQYFLTTNTKDPIILFNEVVSLPNIPMHGNIHHFIDGAVILTIYKNNGGQIDLANALNALAKRSEQMPGAMCGYWGVCGAVTSIGAALSIIDNTGPLSNDGNWDKHMQYTSDSLNALASIGGPRCCKRDAYLSFQQAINYLNTYKHLNIPTSPIQCHFSANNAQCIKQRCPFHKGSEQ